MAVTMTDAGETLYASFNIEKIESTPDGDLLVYGRATDGSVDHDQQIVDPGFSSKAIADWLATGGNVRVQHNPQLYPAGVGVEAHTDGDGGTWVKALIVEPTAKKLVSKGVLRAYSVGIANPTIERDITGKARGGIIKSGKIVEISLVDRPANASCGIQLVKSVEGVAEYTGEIFGSDDAIAKALNATVVKDAGPAVAESVNSIDSFEAPADISFDFTPNDLMKVLQDKMIRRAQNDEAFKAVAAEEAAILGKDHREFSADRRRQLAGSGNALPDGSYPIPDSDALHRASVLARSGHGNVSAARRLIARRAKELGVSNPLDADDKVKYDEGGILPDGLQVVKNDTGVPEKVETLKAASSKPPVDDDDDGDDDDDCSGKEAVPDVVKDPVTAGAADSSGKPAGKKPKKAKKPMPPWVKQESAVSSDTEKCHTDPKTASGAEEAADMDPAPVGELLESPKPDHMKAAAYMRYKTLGIDPDLGILHDLSCPAFHPAEVAKFFPGMDVTMLIDDELWQRKALAAATGKSLSEAMEAQHVWQAACIVKAADPSDLYNYRLELNKAFRDANPGPTSALSPGSISPQKFKRPVITGGHSQLSQGYGSPNSAPSVATSAPNARNFDRPPLGSANASPSPSHMKSGFEYPDQQGVPTRIDYAVMEKEKARRALSMMHDHLIHQFPSVCPILDQDAYRTEQTPPIPQIAGKSAEVEATGEVLGDIYKYMEKLERKVRAGLITEEEARNKLSRKTAQQYAKSLTRQVHKGLTSIDEVKKALGLPVEEVKPVPVPVPEPVVVKTVEPAAGLTPDLMKSMMTEILQPLHEQITAQETRIGEQNELLGKYNEQFEEQKKELDEHRARWEALANSSDPSSAAFTGLALNPVQKARSAGVAKTADANERVQGMMIRQLERAWRTSENPAEREAAYTALQKYKGMTE